MLKFGLFSGQSARKAGLGLLVLLLLLLTAAPQAWGVFEITDESGNPITRENDNYLIDASSNDLTINADKLPDNAVISGEGKKIVVNGSDVNLTLKDLTVTADSGPAFRLNVAANGNANIKIDGTVTLSGNSGLGFDIIADNGFVVLNAVSENSILRTRGIHGLKIVSGSTLLLQGDGEFYCDSAEKTNSGLACHGDIYVGGSVTLSTTGKAVGVEGLTLYVSGSFTLFENAKVTNDNGIWAEYGSVNVMGFASIAEGTIVQQGQGSSSNRVSSNLKRIKVQPPGLYLLSADSGQGAYRVATELTGWGKGWFTGAEETSFESKNFAVKLPVGGSFDNMSFDVIPQDVGEDSFYYLVSLDVTGKKEDLTSAWYVEDSLSVVGYGVRSVDIKAETANIPSGDYTVELSGDSRVSL
ncbi:MAG: hypothetical protein LBO82_06900, partial [Synergistaceae bacterium]|nr:hypothetical protein [Synergistaceae bacterium]